MPTDPTHTQPPAASLSLRAIVWRLALTLFILFTLAGPGAELLQQIAAK